MKPLLTLLTVLLTALPAIADHAMDAAALINKSADGLALQGFDPVAYFTLRKPTKGDANFTATHAGATYRFASAEHRDLFIANPASYVPAYGGFCGYAASVGKVRPINPELWSIIDGTLILQNSKGAVELWEKDVAGNKTKADRYWPRLVDAKAGKKDPIDGLLSRSVLPDVR
jgi:YHS domain-containing protein